MSERSDGTGISSEVATSSDFAHDGRSGTPVAKGRTDMRTWPRFLPYAFLATSALVNLACGRVDDDAESTPSPAAPSFAPQCRPRTATLSSIEDVRSNSIAIGPCGDVLFQKGDDSIWLRTVDGRLDRVAEQGDVGALDPTGTFGSFERVSGTTRESILLDLATRKEIVAPGRVAFGIDTASPIALPFTCGDDGVRVFRSGAFGATIAGTLAGTEALHCIASARLGAVALATNDRGLLAFVDLLHERVVRAAIDFRRDAPTGGRNDAVRLSEDGGVALYQRTTSAACGDTFCGTAERLEVIESGGGSVTARLEIGSLSYLGRPDGPFVERAGSLYDAQASFSVDTQTGALASRKDTTLIRVRDDGSLVLAHRDRAGTTVSIGTARPGETTVTPWFDAPSNASISVASRGRRALVLEPNRSIGVAGSTSTWGAGHYGDVVLRGEDDREVGRYPLFTGFTAQAFSSDGSIFASGVRFAKEPPPEAAELDGLGLAGGVYRIAPTGELTELASPVSDTAIVSIDDTRVGVLVREAEGAPTAKTTMTFIDVGSAAPRVVSENDYVDVVASPWPTPTGVFAATTRGRDGAFATLWHGVP